MRLSRQDLLQRTLAVSTTAAFNQSPVANALGFLAEAAPAGHATQTNVASGVLSTRCEGLIDPLGVQLAHPRLSWATVGEPRSRARQAAYQIVVSSRLNGKIADFWDTGKVASSDVAVEYAGQPIPPHTQVFWRVRTWDSTVEAPSAWSEPARWSVGPENEGDWGGSLWIGRDDLLERTQNQMPGVPGKPSEPNFFPAPYLRHEFQVDGPVRSAFLYAVGLGAAELYLNGARLGDTERVPGFTDFNRRVLYVTHDVTSLLKPGPNALGAILGTSWYDVHDVAIWHFNTAPWRQRPRLRLTLALNYADGTRTFVVSDNTWEAAAGPIRRDGVYTGEVYDARLEISAWNQPGFDASAKSGWKPVLMVDPPYGRLVPLSCEPVRVTHTITPIAITEPKPGIFIVNMGQNFSGHTQLRVKGSAGHAITMRYAEVLNPDGTLNSTPIDRYMENTEPRQPFRQDTYICKGSGKVEVWEQRFSWSGFQYVEVTNFPGTPTLDNFRGRFAHTDVSSAGEFTCSDDTVNRIQHATRWSYLSNAQSYPTDCPQREKNGWTGDAGLACEAGLMNFHSAAFYSKWLGDFSDAQRPDGGVPVLVPNGGWGNGESWPGDICPPWDAAYLIIVWNLYRWTGDRRILVRHREALRRYVAFFLSHRNSSGLCPALGIGDWSAWKTGTPQNYITNAYLYLDLDLMAKLCGVLGDTQQAHYAALAQEIGRLTHKAFYNPSTHQYSNGSRMAQGTALYFGFAPESERSAVFADLVRQLDELGHLDVGILGAKHVLRSLAEGGRVDLAYKLATQPSMPSYGYWVKTAGSTTLWESWRGGSSCNHIMFGDISAWFYNWIAGIQQEPDSIAFEKILFRPTPVGGPTHATATYLSPHGVIGSAWTLKGRCLQITLQVPIGAAARLVLPVGARLIHGCGSSGGRESGSAELVLNSGKHSVEALLA